MIAPWKIFGRFGNSLFQYAYIYAQSRRTGQDIYLQDPKYFEGYEDEIRSMLQQTTSTLDMVAIHVRRGDYVNNPFYVDLTSTPYYYNAMKMFPVGTKFLVFSDDIEWCKAYFVGDEFEFHERGTEVEDVTLMADCKAIIIANSSFSWWGAFLGDKNKKVIAPKAWYTDLEERTKCPSTWIRI